MGLVDDVLVAVVLVPQLEVDGCEGEVVVPEVEVEVVEMLLVEMAVEVEDEVVEVLLVGVQVEVAPHPENNVSQISNCHSVSDTQFLAM